MVVIFCTYTILVVWNYYHYGSRYVVSINRRGARSLRRGALIGGLAAAAVVGAGGWRYARLVVGPTMAKLKPTTRGLMLRDYLQHARRQAFSKW